MFYSRSFHWRGLGLLLTVCGLSVSQTLLGADEERLRLFQDSLDFVRTQYRIPGLSAAIVKNQQIIWEQGYGYADIASGIAARPDTPYLIASLTKTFTSVLLMSCVERGTLNLDDPIRNYTKAIPEAGVTVRHVFYAHVGEHTSRSGVSL